MPFRPRAASKCPPPPLRPRAGQCCRMVWSEITAGGLSTLSRLALVPLATHRGAKKRGRNACASLDLAQDKRARLDTAREQVKDRRDRAAASCRWHDHGFDSSSFRGLRGAFPPTATCQWRQGQTHMPLRAHTFRQDEPIDMAKVDPDVCVLSARAHRSSNLATQRDGACVGLTKGSS